MRRQARPLLICPHLTKKSARAGRAPYKHLKLGIGSRILRDGPGNEAERGSQALCFVGKHFDVICIDRPPNRGADETDGRVTVFNRI